MSVRAYRKNGHPRLTPLAERIGFGVHGAMDE
jgi:hypothetical protein